MKKIKHPLAEPESLGRMLDIEKNHTVDELINWCAVTLSMKTADTEEKELMNAIRTYKAELQNLLSRSQTMKYISVKEAMKLLEKEWTI